MDESCRLTIDRKLRALDAVHLATANVIRAALRSKGETLVFISSDQALLDAARLEQHDTENPAEFLE
ncbi:MAG: hypothetical protein JNJ88_10235 [Planctomycetes bacterium]|nr:hypothetical protein [Planctomycetota bacterium]